MKITQTTQDWGNSTGIRIPKKVLQAVKWQNNQKVTIDIQGSAIILKPSKVAKPHSPSIEELVAGITPENVHKELDWGDPVGKEVW